MIQKMIAMLAVSLILVGCGGTKEKSDGAEGGVGDDQIEAMPISFDPMGSDSGNIPGLSSITFEYDKAVLTTEARRVLAENANWLSQNGNVNLQIEGHCDNRGSSEYNLSLGERRANSVKSYLISLGVQGQRLSVVSYGEEKPLEMGDTESAWAKNRRANFVPLAQ